MTDRPSNKFPCLFVDVPVGTGLISHSNLPSEFRGGHHKNGTNLTATHISGHTGLLILAFWCLAPTNGEWHGSPISFTGIYSLKLYISLLAHIVNIFNDPSYVEKFKISLWKSGIMSIGYPVLSIIPKRQNHFC